MKSADDIILRPIEKDDTDLIIKWRNKEIVRKHFIYQELFTKETHLRWMDTKVKTGEVAQFIIQLKSSNYPIGSTYLRDIDNVHKKAEYGIFIGETDYMGKGFGTKVAKMMLDYAYNTIGLHRVYLRVFANNERAINSYLKAGFAVEGILRGDAFVDGKFRDIVWMAALNKGEQ